MMQGKGLLKFLTCGSVDDGKSTLIGHMLYDAKLIFADQKQALEMDSRVGSRDGQLDYSLLLDGLMAEREQGITIDVAYRYFTTKKRSFIVADTPGHEEYTRNMAVGAAFADLAVVLMDATKGVLLQTKRHTRICAFMGIKHVVFAINKMDLVSYSFENFIRLKKEIKKLVAEFDFATVVIIPVSATEGDNITKLSSNMQWYDGKTLLQYLEDVEITQENQQSKFVMPVQRVVRPNADFRGFQGQVESGALHVGEELMLLPSGEKAKLSQAYVADKPATEIFTGQAVTICLDKEIDVSRGCVFVKNFQEAQLNNLFSASLLWMDDTPLSAGRNYLLKIGTKLVPATVMKIKYKIDINTGEEIVARGVYKNDFVVCDISVAEKIVLAEFACSEVLGGFILIDRISNMTSGCGTVLHTLRRGDNLFWQHMDIDRAFRSNQLGQNPLTIWFTGLSGSGKSALANELEKQLAASGKHTMLLDGDNIRQGLNKNLGFTREDRSENIRRIAEAARLLNDAGIIVLTSFISPYAEDREMARQIIGNDNFVEVYVSTPLSVCEERDVKGLYKKARAGKIPNFTGISSPFEQPVSPDAVVDTSKFTMDKAVESILEILRDNYNLEAGQ